MFVFESRVRESSATDFLNEFEDVALTTDVYTTIQATLKYITDYWGCIPEYGTQHYLDLYLSRDYAVVYVTTTTHSVHDLVTTGPTFEMLIKRREVRGSPSEARPINLQLNSQGTIVDTGISLASLLETTHLNK